MSGRPWAPIMAAAGRAYGTGRLAQAETGYRRVVAEWPTHSGALLFLAKLDIAAGRRAAARHRLRRMLRVVPGAPVALIDLARCDADDRRALAALRAAMLVLPHDPGAALAFAHRRHAAGDGRAADAALRACRLGPHEPDGWGAHGGFSLFRGDHEAAERSFRIAVLLQPERADLHYRLGRVRVFRMRQEAARAAFARALRIAPDDRTVQQWHRRSAGWAAKRRLRMATAARWLTGAGIEIGAMHEPLEPPAGASVRYVDYLPLDEQRRRNPELDCFALIPPDLLDDGERLDSIPDGSLDFIVANHFLEHCEDPLGTLACHAAKLRPGGVLFYAVPHAVNQLDRRRPITTLDHVVMDSRDGGAGTRQLHYREVARLTFGLDGEAAERRAEVMMRERQTIHFHVWDAAALRAVFELAARGCARPLALREFVEAGEMIVVLQAAADAALSPPPP